MVSENKLKIQGLGIRSKVAVVLLSTTLLAIIITGAVYHARSQNELINLINNHFISVAKLQAHQLEQTLTNNYERLALITSRTQLRLSFAAWLALKDQRQLAKTHHISKMEKILIDAKTAVPGIIKLTVADLNGLIVASTNNFKPGDSVAKKYLVNNTRINSPLAFFEKATNTTNKIVLQQALSIEDNVLGILIMESDLSEIKELLRTHKGLGITEETFLVFKDSNQELRNLNPSKLAESSIVKVSINPFLAQSDSEQVQSYIDYRGVEVFAMTKVFSDINVGMVFKIDKAEALQVINEQSDYLYISLLVAAVVVLIIAFILGQSITRPVIDLVSVATMIAQGDLTKRIETLSKDELGLLAVSFNQMADQLIDANKHLEQKIKEKTEELILTNEHLLLLTDDLQRMTLKDGLTDIANRRAFDQQFEIEWKRSQREHSYLALILIDIDCFKQYNDTLGHTAGDECLIKVAQVIEKQSQREGDLVARYGGEEFVVLLPNTQGDDSLIIANRIKDAIEKCAIPHPASKVGSVVTVSMGVGATTVSLNQKAITMVEKVDNALYKAKESGRNQIIFTEINADNA